MGYRRRPSCAGPGLLLFGVPDPGLFLEILPRTRFYSTGRPEIVLAKRLRVGRGRGDTILIDIWLESLGGAKTAV